MFINEFALFLPESIEFLWLKFDKKFLIETDRNSCSDVGHARS